MPPTATRSQLQPDIDRLRDHIATRQREQIAAHQAAEDLVASMRSEGVDLTASEHFDRVDEAYRARDEIRQDVAESQGRLNRLLSIAGEAPEVEPTPTGPGRDERTGRRDLATRFLESDVYRQALAAGRLSPTAPAVGSLDEVPVASPDEMRAFLAATADVGDMVPEDIRVGLVAPIPVRSIRLLDAITVGTTDSDTVEYVEETTRTDAAAETAAGDAAPEATYVVVRRSVSVREIVHNTPATRANLRDAGQAETFLRNRLETGVRLRTEKQVLDGNGVGENLLGIRSTSGIGSVSLNSGASEPRLEAIHRGITSVRINLEREPNAIGIHPTTYEQLVFSKDTTNRYQLQTDPSAMAPRTVWGYPAIISTVFTVGEAVVGDYSEAYLWVREGMRVNAYDQHLDFAAKRLVLMQAAYRAAFKAIQPKAFTVVDGL